MIQAAGQEPGAYRTWREALGSLRGTWRALLGVHIAFTLLGVIIFAPLVGLTGRLLMRLSGEPAVADQDIAWFFLSPAGLVALVIFAGLAIGILAFEQAAMIRVVVGQLEEHRTRAISALRFAAARFPRLFWFSVHLAARVLFVLLEFLAIGAAIAWGLIREYDINYYLTARPPEFLVAVVLIGIVFAIGALVLARKLLNWSLALPLVLFEKIPPRASFAMSTRRVQGWRLPVLGSLVLWGLSAIALGLVVVAFVRIVGGIAVPPFSGDLSLLVVVLGLLGLLLAALNVLVTTFTSGHFAAIIADYYVRLSRREGKVPAIPPDAGPRTAFLTRRQLAAGMVIAAVMAVLSATWMVTDVQLNDTASIIAHRGAAGRAPENTLAAIEAAIEDDADWVEIDVQEAADGTVVVAHDSDFMKLSGVATKVWDATPDELAGIDIGSWFGTEFAGERVPTLRQVLELTRGQSNVVIELKYYGHDERLEERVAEIVEATGMSDSIALMSLKYPAVQKMKQLRPDWTVGLLSATAIGDLTRLEADFLAVSANMVSSGFVRRAREAGKQVFAWTVNDPVTMSRMLSFGVDGVITDEPAMAREVLAERADMSSAERLLLAAAMVFGRDFETREYRDDSP